MMDNTNFLISLSFDKISAFKFLKKTEFGYSFDNL